MSFEEIALIVEIVGIVAIFITLFYLSKQINQSTKVSMRERLDEANQRMNSWTEHWASNKEYSDLMFKGFTAPNSLDPTERFRFYAALLAAFRNWESILDYSREKGMPGWFFSNLETGLQDFVSLPGAIAYWHARKHWYSRDFQKSIDVLIASNSEDSSKGNLMKSWSEKDDSV
jgi:hypothetical protein